MHPTTNFHVTSKMKYFKYWNLLAGLSRRSYVELFLIAAYARLRPIHIAKINVSYQYLRSCTHWFWFWTCCIHVWRLFISIRSPCPWYSRAKDISTLWDSNTSHSHCHCHAKSLDTNFLASIVWLPSHFEVPACREPIDKERMTLYKGAFYFLIHSWVGESSLRKVTRLVTGIMLAFW